ncbi:MAG: transcriptional regulator [Gallionellales bacterium GWA2_60_142]|nr:MAG: transcriptional regulator [Gallionellales bacterium GWA2_60_142]HCI14378.1 transcriptional regulator [Gallionellaceae bacterium]
MTEATQLIATIKKQLKSQGMTYRDVARALKLSEPSVKRLFASERFTIDRLVQVSDLLGYTLAELAKEAQAGQPRLSTLTEKQEREVVSDTKLLVVAVCALNHWTQDEIVAFYRVSHAECIKLLLRLDKLRIIDLLPGNRIRINVSRDFDWLPNGPIRQYFQGRGLGDFLKSGFSNENESMAFANGMFTEQAQAQIQEELRRLRQKFAELHEASLSAPLGKRSGVGLLLAMRQWEPADFAKLRR